MTMKISSSYIALCKPGLSHYCVKELEQFSIKTFLKSSESVEFQLATTIQLKTIFQKISTAYSLSEILWQGTEEKISKLIFTEDMFKRLLSYFPKKPPELKFRVLCERISGNETRINLGATVQKIIAQKLEKEGIKSIVNYKNPEFIFSLSQEPKTKTFTLGIKLHLSNLDKRDWRVYTHKASFRGDFAASICQSANISSSQKKIVSLFSRDGAIAIEAACKIFDLPIRDLSKILQAKLSKETKTNIESKLEKERSKQIILIDDSSSNIRASSNNAKLAGISDNLTFLSTPMDQISSKLEEASIDIVIVQMTNKDERRINEVLRQVTLMLKPEGKVLFVVRAGFEMEGDSKFFLLWHKLIPRGSGNISLYYFEKRD